MKSGANLAYRTWGIRGGAPLVLLHGFLGDSGDWESLAQTLENDFYMVAIDLPGHGQSKDISVDQSHAFQAFSQLLTDTLLQLGLKQYSLLGYSLGGRLAMYHAAQAFESIDKLLVESAHPGLESEVAREERWKSDKNWAEQFRSEPVEAVLQRWYHQPVFADLNSRSREALMKYRCTNHQTGDKLAETLEAFSLAKQPDFWGELGSASYAVHYLYGQRDLKFQEIAQTLVANGGALSVHSIEHAGHNVHREQPEAMGQLIHKLFV